MKRSRPSKFMFILSIIVVLVAVASLYVKIPYVSGHAFWVLLGGYGVLFLGNIIKGF